MQHSQLLQYSPVVQASLQNRGEGIPEPISSPELRTPGFQFDEPVFSNYELLSDTWRTHQDQNQPQIHTPDSSHPISLSHDLGLEDMFDLSSTHSEFMQPFEETGDLPSNISHASSSMAPTRASNPLGYHRVSRCNICSPPPHETPFNPMIHGSEWNQHEFHPCICHRQNSLSRSAGRKSVVDELLQIYQGSFENSMSCWVTPQTCPYKVVDLVPTVDTADGTSTISFFNRASSLDKAFSSLRNHPNGTTQTYPPSKALQVAIMAFSSQWTHSQGNGRSGTDISMEIANTMEFEKLL